MAIESRKNKDGSESFRARVKDPEGKFYRAEWKRDREEALLEEAAQLKQKKQGKLVRLEDDGKKYTYQEYWEVWAACDRTDTSEGWKISQDQMNRDYILPVLGKMKMSDITMPHIGKVLNRMKELGRGAQLRLHVYRLMNQVFDRAVNYYRMIPSNPVSAEYHRPKVSETESMFLTPKQSWLLIEEAVKQDERAVLIELLSGLRTEATLALMWPCVQWDLNQILICRAFKQKIRRIEDFPKGRKAEYVPMTPVLKDYLWEIYQRTEDKDGFVCPGPRGGFLKPETYGPRLKKLCRKAGVPEVSPHILRHSCTEMFVQEGATQEDLRRLLNHKSGATTLRYMHRTDGRLSAIAARIKKPELRLVAGRGESVTHGVTQMGNFQRMQTEAEVSNL